MNDADWVNVDTFADRFSAAALVGLLAGEGVPAHIASDEPLPGLARSFSVLVAPPLLDRARWILSQEPVSESELTDLALGTAGSGGDEFK